MLSIDDDEAPLSTASHCRSTTDCCTAAGFFVQFIPLSCETDDADLVQRALEVGEVDVALVVVGDVGVAAAGRRVRPRADRRDEMELLSVVRRAVDEGLVRREAPRARLPDRPVAVDGEQRLALGALRIDDGRRTRTSRSRSP